MTEPVLGPAAAPPRSRYLGYLLVIDLTAAATCGISALLMNVMERKEEARQGQPADAGGRPRGGVRPGAGSGFRRAGVGPAHDAGQQARAAGDAVLHGDPPAGGPAPGRGLAGAASDRDAPERTERQRRGSVVGGALLHQQSEVDGSGTGCGGTQSLADRDPPVRQLLKCRLVHHRPSRLPSMLQRC
jgi:hypothetical protein